jgi:hypothetical protein
MFRVIAGALMLMLAAACGGDNGSPTSPSGPPAVNGNYSGSVTVNFPELNAAVTCPASTVVTQSGSTVNVAPIVLTGQCGNLSVPLGQVTIDNTGALDGSGSSGTFFEPSCGGNYNYTGSGGFFGREFRLSMTATSAVCFNFNFTAVLTR